MAFKIPNEVEYNPKEFTIKQKIIWTWKLWRGFSFKLKVKVKTE